MPITYPSIGEWYKSAVGDSFEVVAIDEDDGTVDIQHFDGTVEEVDIANWDELAAVPIEAPEDWSGSMDVEREDYGQDIDLSPDTPWAQSLDDLDRDE